MPPPPLLRRRDHLGHRTLLTAQARLETLLPDARAQEVSSADFLDRLLSEEMRAQGEQAVARRTVMARFPSRTTLESVAHGFPPSVDRQKLQDRATGRFLEHGETIVFLGPPGTGTPHVAMGLGLKAIQPGHRPLFTAAVSLIATLTTTYADNRCADRGKLDPGPQLLMIDAMGSRPIDRHGAPLFCPLISRRDARGAILLTAHHRFGQGAERFGDPLVASAILDRLLHPSQVMNLQGDSSRFREKQQAGLLNKAPAPDAG